MNHGWMAIAAVLVWTTFTPPGQSPPQEKDTVGSDRLVEMAGGDRQWTGVAVSAQGRVFVNFPRWQPQVPVSVAELDERGNVTPYPNDEINSWSAGEDPTKKFVCVQSVHVDRRDRLWILDPASPMLGGVVARGPKLMRVNLTTNEVEWVHVFDETIAPSRSYLNDVRIDTESNTAFITDSGLGAIVVVDVETGSARRVLGDHPSTKAEKTSVTIDGRPIPFVVHCDGIALDQDGGWLYYQALTGRTMYRVPVTALRDDELSAEEVAEQVERFADSGVSDGLLFAPGGVYVSSLEDGAIKVVDGDGRVKTLVKDPRIIWPDSFALGPDGAVWFTTSQIHLGPNPKTPYRVLKISPR
jgi:sugar lactone lactonase YvrE